VAQLLSERDVSWLSALTGADPYTVRVWWLRRTAQLDTRQTIYDQLEDAYLRLLARFDHRPSRPGVIQEIGLLEPISATDLQWE
jgi:hypothetical protein